MVCHTFLPIFFGYEGHIQALVNIGVQGTQCVIQPADARRHGKQSHQTDAFPQGDLARRRLQHHFINLTFKCDRHSAIGHQRFFEFSGFVCSNRDREL